MSTLLHSELPSGQKSHWLNLLASSKTDIPGGHLDVCLRLVGQVGLLSHTVNIKCIPTSYLFFTLLYAWAMATQGLLSAPSLIWFTSHCVWETSLTIFVKIFTDRLYPIPKLLLSKHLAWQSYGAGSCNDILTASFKMGIFLSLSSTLSSAPGIYQIPNKLFTGIKGRCVF